MVAALWLVTLVTVIAALVAMRLPLPFWSTTAIVLLCSVVGGVCAGIASGIITDLLHERRDRRGVPE